MTDVGTNAALGAILCWAAGRGDTPPEPDVHPLEEDLVRAVRRHRLSVRLLHRLQGIPASDRPSWGDDALLARLRVLRARAVLSQERSIGILREIAERCSPGKLPIPVKGFVTYALTGEDRHIRLSGDLDLLGPDAESLCSVLVSLGFAGDVYDAARHEYAHLRRRSPVGSVAAVEVHRFFPVYSYPSELPLVRCSTDHEDHREIQRYERPKRSEIRYADLLACSLLVRREGMPALRVPEPAMAALLLCAHEFKEYLTSPLELSVPVRLSVLADVGDLLQHPGFDPARFGMLVQQFRAWDAVALIDRLLKLWLGADALRRCPDLAEDSRFHRSYFPRAIGFRGAWAEPYPPEAGLLPRTQEDILRHCDYQITHTMADVTPREAVHAECHRVPEGIGLVVRSAVSGQASCLRLRMDWEAADSAAGASLALESDGRTWTSPDLAKTSVAADIVSRGEGEIHIVLPSEVFPPHVRAGGGGRLQITWIGRDHASDDFFDAYFIQTLPLVF